MELISLPPETLLQILYNLDYQAILRCREVCTLFNHLITTDTVLQYKIELASAGLVDASDFSSTSCTLPVAARLQELKTTQRNWSTLTFRAKHTLPQVPWSRVWELFGGVLALGLTEGNSVRGLSMTRLPSATGSQEPKAWVLPDLGVDIRDFGMDPAQDLLVLISVALVGSVANPQMECRLHLRSLTTGKPHPHATDSVLFCRPAISIIDSAFVIQVMDDYVGLLFHPPLHPGLDFRDQLFIWNWKTGKLISYLRHRSQPRMRMDSFSFISPTHFVVTQFKIMPASNFVPSLMVYDFVHTVPAVSARVRAGKSATDQPPAPKLLRTFKLPELNDGSIMVSMMTRSDPAPTRMPDPVPIPSLNPTSPPGAASTSEPINKPNHPSMPLPPLHPSLQLPFYTVPLSSFDGHTDYPAPTRILTVALALMLPNLATTGLMLFVGHEVLIDEGWARRVAGEDSSHLDEHDSPLGGVEIPWSFWGPKHTRLLPMEGDPSWVCYVHGTKYVRVDEVASVGWGGAENVRASVAAGGAPGREGNVGEDNEDNDDEYEYHESDEDEDGDYEVYYEAEGEESDVLELTERIEAEIQAEMHAGMQVEMQAEIDRLDEEEAFIENAIAETDGDNGDVELEEPEEREPDNQNEEEMEDAMQQENDLQEEIEAEEAAAEEDGTDGAVTGSWLSMYEFNPLVIRRALQQSPSLQSPCPQTTRSSRSRAASPHPSHPSYHSHPSSYHHRINVKFPRPLTQIYTSSNPTIVPSSELIFESDVETCLPYMRVCTDTLHEFEGVMIDEGGCLIGVGSDNLRGRNSPIEFLCI